jgi:hypothetical protein
MGAFDPGDWAAKYVSIDDRLERTRFLRNSLKQDCAAAYQAYSSTHNRELTCWNLFETPGECPWHFEETDVKAIIDKVLGSLSKSKTFVNTFKNCRHIIAGKKDGRWMLIYIFYDEKNKNPFEPFFEYFGGAPNTNPSIKKRFPGRVDRNYFCDQARIPRWLAEFYKIHDGFGPYDSLDSTDTIRSTSGIEPLFDRTPFWFMNGMKMAMGGERFLKFCTSDGGVDHCFLDYGESKDICEVDRTDEYTRNMDFWQYLNNIVAGKIKMRLSNQMQ